MEEERKKDQTEAAVSVESGATASDTGATTANRPKILILTLTISS